MGKSGSIPQNCLNNNHDNNNSDRNEDTTTLNLTDTAHSPAASVRDFTTVMTKKSATLHKLIQMFRFLCQLLVMMMFRFWLFCSSASLILLLAFWFYGGLITLALLHIAILGLLYNAQDMLLFYPEQPPHSRLFVDSPYTLGLQHESLNIRTRDGVLIHMFLVKQPAHLLSAAPTFIYFHGNAGNIGHRLTNVQALCANCHVNVLLVEYRGYGKSQGSPSEHGLYFDGQAALDYIFTRPDINQKSLIVFGRSLGGAVAVHLCSMPYYASRISCLIVENTFTSLPEMARSIFNFRVLHYLPDWCHKNKFPSRSHVPKINTPSLFISGLQDNLVPPTMMFNLYEVSTSRMKRLALFPGGTHNETWQLPGYYHTVNQFLLELKKLNQGDQVANEQVFTVQSS